MCGVTVVKIRVVSVLIGMCGGTVGKIE